MLGRDQDCVHEGQAGIHELEGSFSDLCLAEHRPQEGLEAGEDEGNWDAERARVGHIAIENAQGNFEGQLGPLAMLRDRLQEQMVE